MEGLGPKDEGEGGKGGKGDKNRPGARSRRDEGGSDGGDGGEGGGREELLSYYCTGGTTRLSCTSLSGVTNNLSSHNYYCRQLFISGLLSPRLSSSHSLFAVLKLKAMEGTPHAIPLSDSLIKGVAHFQHRAPSHVVMPWPAE